MRAVLTRRAAIASVTTALGLALIKTWAAIETNSVAVLASLADSAIDLIASLVTLAGVTYAAQPPDADHRFGHGKAEALAALFQVAVIAVSAVLILARAVDALLHGSPAANPEYGIAVSVIAMAATLALTSYQQRVVRSTGSVAIGTDRIHYQSDLLLNASVILALVLDQYVGIRGADALLGVAIAGWLLFGAWRASLQAVHQLMDREWPEEKRRRFVAVAARHPALKNLHDLRTRSSGIRDFAQFHLGVDGQMSVSEAHRIVDDVERALKAAFPDTDILIHIDPEDHIDVQAGPLARRDETEILDDTP